MSGAHLRRLHAELDALGAALEAQDLVAAGAAAAAYDGALRRDLEQRGSDAPVPALRELLRRQDALLARMREQQDRIAGELRRMRTAGAASRAYATAGTGP